MNWLRRFDPRRSLTLRLLWLNLALILLALGGLVLWAGLRLQRTTLESIEHELELQTLLVADSLREPVHDQLEYGGEEREGEHDEDEGDRGLAAARLTPVSGRRDVRSLIDSFAAQLDARVTLIAPNLVALYSSYDATPPQEEQRYPEVEAALQGLEQHDIRVDAWTGEERLFVAAPIANEGVVQLSLPMTQVNGQVRSAWLTLVSAALFVALIGILVASLLAQQLLRPVRSLTAAAHRLAGGDLSTRLELDRPDEMGQLAEAFDHMAEEISQLLQRERAFVANASHELRSPLAAIRLRAELLQTIDDPERRLRYAGEIEAETLRLAGLAEHLLTLDRIERGEERAELSPNPAGQMRDMASFFAPQAERAGLNLHSTLPSTLPALALDPAALDLLLRNLLDNAIKYTPRGGEVSLAASSEQDRVRIVVQDSGIGIPAADLPHVFERFYRVDRARDRTGSGLGLALVKAIVEACGGEIELKSTESRGTTVMVFLPVASS